MSILKHNHVIRVRYAETDQMGIVWNGNYSVYFEIGRTELMREYGIQYRELEEEGYILPLADLYSKFIKPAHYDDVLTIRTELEWNNSAALKFVYTILREDTVIAEGYTTHMFVKSDTRVPVKPPKIFKDSIKTVIEGKATE